MLIQWKPAYRRGFALQAPLAIAGCVLGLWAWWGMGHWQWLLGALLMIANWPYTLFVIMPVNHQLMAIEATLAGRESRELMIRWGSLHAGRSVLGGAATLMFLWASLR